MEKFEELRNSAQKRIHIADHMLTQTYPLIQDPKLLLAVLENTFLALSHSMSSVLYHERLFKKIPAFPENFESKFQLFKDRCIEKYHLDQKYLELIREIKDIIVQHRKSPIEFVRKDHFVICTDNYRMKTINIDQMRKYVSEAKIFVSEASNLLTEQESLYS